jgi:hypothetical protein
MKRSPIARIASALVGFAALACLAGALAPAAMASDGKIFPGGACFAETPSQDTDLQRGTDGKVLNGAGSTRWVVCPVVREYGSSTEGALVDVDVNINAPTGRTVNCYIYSKSATGGSTSFQNASVTGGGAQTLDIGEPAVTYTNGYYYIECSLGSTAAVYSYLTLETGP